MRASPLLMTALRTIAWTLFGLLMLFWAIEAAHCMQHYAAGGWPALLGYLQTIPRGHRPGPPPSWSVIVLSHLIILLGTLMILWFLRWCKRVPLLRLRSAPSTRESQRQRLKVCSLEIPVGCPIVSLAGPLLDELC
jgi:hypothetical protein